MRVFVCILERGSLSAATRELGLTQLAVSNHLHAAVEGAVAAGAGMGVVPTRTLDAGSVVSRIEFRGLTFHRPFVLVTERERPLSPAAEAFVATRIGKGNA